MYIAARLPTFRNNSLSNYFTLSQKSFARLLLDFRNQNSQTRNNMKKSGIFAASVAAAASATATAISASSSSTSWSNSKIHISREEDVSSKNNENSSSQIPSSSDKFAPRFDGLRFIETLITGHR